MPKRRERKTNTFKQIWVKPKNEGEGGGAGGGAGGRGKYSESL